uniref:SGNH hydrolase-type esterase domain-containing protein n=1 Tax=Chromera velia CCMP2878 TaxID=1169474 RepID=A0A0G4IBD2_9ALVE|eukprot:Cvel_12717.t1-p1 / transcript=Cvel_12717.t1 / gene=Cvel_12717 / organism=Chromera_velia_CCMP2878 / gene_product=hypothetical protein / transcript_product=hypothetical protein / location=Cvel_scaffold843:57970-62581(-) / protein_length=486 / sequence_SO=supercontig / SO=protein_coding / is_pseudo=false
MVGLGVAQGLSLRKNYVPLPRSPGPSAGFVSVDETAGKKNEDASSSSSTFPRRGGAGITSWVAATNERSDAARTVAYGPLGSAQVWSCLRHRQVERALSGTKQGEGHESERQAVSPSAGGEGQGQGAVSAKQTKGRKSGKKGKEKERNPPLRVLFVGDSLVLGIGCELARYKEEGPVLPRAFCERLAERTGRNVVWQAISKNGADVQTVHKTLFSEVKTACLQVAKGEGGAEKMRGEGKDDKEGGADVCVIVCGLNDMKDTIVHRRSPREFRTALSNLVSALHGEVGPNCAIILPALPVEVCTSFNVFPVFHLIRSAMALWDLQKVGVLHGLELRGAGRSEESLVESLLNICIRWSASVSCRFGESAFVGKPSHAELSSVTSERNKHGEGEYGKGKAGGKDQRDTREERERSAERKHLRQAATVAMWPEAVSVSELLRRSEEAMLHLVAADGVHPSDLGYAVWGDFLAREAEKLGLLDRFLGIANE